MDTHLSDLNEMIPAAKREPFFFGLLILIVIGLWAATLDAQPKLIPGDMGRDLYAYHGTLEGKWPCRDYWWQYGPMMLFYYGFWMKVLGTSILSVRVGLGVIYLMSSVIAFRILRLVASPGAAFLGALAFQIRGLYFPYYTFNHEGAIPFLLLSIYFLWKYFYRSEWRYCLWGTISLAGMALVKSNVGITSFSAFFLSLALYEFWMRREGPSPMTPKRWLLLPALFLLLAGLPYLVMYSGYPLHYVDQCLTMRAIYKEPGYSVRTALIHLVLRFFLWERVRLAWVALFALFLLFGFLGFRRNPAGARERKVFYCIEASLFLYWLFNFTDYALFGQYNRFDFWSVPLMILACGLLGEWSRALWNQRIHFLLALMIFIGILTLPALSVCRAFAMRVPERYLDLPRGKVYVADEELSTVRTIHDASQYLFKNTRPGDRILGIPYLPIYAYLAGRDVALRELNLTTYDNVTDWQENRMVRDLKNQPVPFVVISNADIGQFGVKYSVKLANYVKENYELVETYGGPWKVKSPERFHAVQIWKRKS